jgi:hypothetical protein
MHMPSAFHLERNFDRTFNKPKVIYVVFKKERLLFSSESMPLIFRFAPVFFKGKACFPELLYLKNKSRYLQKGLQSIFKKSPAMNKLRKLWHS